MDSQVPRTASHANPAAQAAVAASVHSAARVSPFAFPSDTDLRFILLVVSVLGSSLFLWNILHNSVNRRLIPEVALACDAKLRSVGAGGLFDRNVTSISAVHASAGALRECTAPLDRSIIPWSLGGSALVIAVAIAMYWLTPTLVRRRGGLVPLTPEDSPDMLAALDSLAREAGLDRAPQFLLNPHDPSDGGLAFGRLGRYFVALNAGLVTKFYTDPPAFNAVVRHELAHLRNGDVDKTYFAVAVWWAFVTVALAPVILVAWDWPADSVLGLASRIAVLTALVYLTRNAVLRSREVYADVRAAIWDGQTGALERVLTKGVAPPAASQSRRSWLRRLRDALRVHPDPHFRARAISDPSPLLRIGWWDAFGAGIAATVAFSSISRMLTGVTNLAISATQLPETSTWIGLTAGEIGAIGAAFVVAPLIAGVATLGAWRGTFARLAQGDAPATFGHIGLALGLGTAAGLSLGLEAALDVTSRAEASSVVSVVTLAWDAALVAGFVLFAQWVSAGAALWLRVPPAEAPRRPFAAGVIVSSIVLGAWLGPFLFWRSMLTPIIETFAAGQNAAAVAVALVPLAVMGALPVFVYTAVHPLTALALILFWAFPLAAGFYRQRSDMAHDQLPSSWAYLDAPSSAMRWRAVRVPLSLDVIARGAATTGMLYTALLLAGRVLYRLLLSQDVRDADASRLMFFVAQAGSAVLMQVVLAVIVARNVGARGPRLTAGLHGLAAASLAGCAMATAILLLNLLFGGTLDPLFVRSVFGIVVNLGALLGLPAALLAAATAPRHVEPTSEDAVSDVRPPLKHVVSA